MKKILFVLSVTLLAAGMIIPQAAAQKKKTETVVFDAGITCENCKKTIEASIPFEKGVKDLTVEVRTKKITVTYDPDKTDAEKIRQAIEKLGYSAKLAESAKSTEPEKECS